MNRIYGETRVDVPHCEGREVKRLAQRSMHCRCGNPKILAHGLCATCYTPKRQDEEYFDGLRETVLKRDGYCCQVCGASGYTKRSIVVHHRKPGVSVLP